MRLPITVEVAGGNQIMLHYLVLFLESLFFVGLAGSMVVAIMAFVGDFSDFFEKDKPEGAASRAIGD
ncbi:MAG: hypothetical protein ACXV99_15650 [Candidatus Angelobacter sp.]